MNDCLIYSFIHKFSKHLLNTLAYCMILYDSLNTREIIPVYGGDLPGFSSFSWLCGETTFPRHPCGWEWPCADVNGRPLFSLLFPFNADELGELGISELFYSCQFGTPFRPKLLLY